VSPRIGFCGTAEHAHAASDGGASSGAPATTNNTADNGTYGSAFHSALQHLRRSRCARPNTNPKQGKAADQNGAYADGCHQNPSL
jgi:hypothetical protein